MDASKEFDQYGRGAGTSCPHNTDKLRGPVNRSERLDRERAQKFREWPLAKLPGSSPNPTRSFGS